MFRRATWIVATASSLLLTGPDVAQASDVTDAVEAALDRAAASNDFEAVGETLDTLFDRAFVGEADDETLLEVAFARRLVGQLGSLDAEVRPERLRALRGHPGVANTLVFLAQPTHDDLDRVYRLYDRLLDARPEAFDKYPTLVAALCVVHDGRVRRRINENMTVAADPLALFDYFTANEENLLFGLRNVPAELLVYVVDSTSSISEMQWALDRYAGHRAVGELFFAIDYDNDHFKKGAPKKVTVAGFSLPNILNYGGVCADQAFYATSVGKAIGVPTAYTVGRSSEVAHAWVGFLQSRGRAVGWNFRSGRYEAYQGVRGVAMDPQIKKYVPDSDVSLLAELAVTKTASRFAAAAWTDAAVRLEKLLERGEPLPDDAASIDVEMILELVERGLRRSAGHVPAWDVVRRLAADDRLTLAQKKRWAGVLHNLCGERYPDFYFAILAPMIRSIENVKEQDALWKKALSLFGRRHDLAAGVLDQRARMWQAAGEPARAGRQYELIIERYANAGPFVLRALSSAERILVEGRQPRKVLELYDQAYRRIDRPKQSAGPFFRQSNFFKVGRRYAERLDGAGLGRQAAMIRREIGDG